MNRKYVAVALSLVFLLGTPSLGLCLTDKPHHKSDCCSDKKPSIPADSEDCLWHCAAKKIVGTKTEDFSIETLKISASLFLPHIVAGVSPHSVYHSNCPTNFYLGHSITFLNIHQIYPEAISSRAPPLLSS